MRKRFYVIPFLALTLSACTSEGDETEASAPATTAIVPGGVAAEPSVEIEPLDYVIGYNSSFVYGDEEVAVNFYGFQQGEDAWYVTLGSGLLGDGWDIVFTDGESTLEPESIAEVSSFTLPLEPEIDWEKYDQYTVTTPDGETIDGVVNPVYLK